MSQMNAAMDSVKITQALHSSLFVSVMIGPDFLDVAEEAA
jgi:hypothetical protein